ncbi:MAG: portal protein [Desulfocucumaceae bacterium]
MSLISTAKRVIGKLSNKVNGTLAWDMTSKEARESQVKRDYEFAKTERSEQTAKWKTLNNYYNGKCYSRDQVTELAEKYGYTFVPPSLPYPFMHVESQIDNVVPSHQFKGRDDDLDSERAKVREQVVDFIYYNNKIEDLNLDNERALNELGNAFWKVAWDAAVQVTPFVKGDIVIGNPDPANIFPDPSAYDIDDCEWIIYAFRMHRRKARRVFGKVIDSITSDADYSDTEIYEHIKRSVDDDTMLVLEYWYKDDEGDIACSIQINNVEVKHIKKYWARTRLSGNKMFPIVKYSKTPVRKSFWDKGEIETIMDLCDAANREFFTALLNDAFCANDIIVYAKDALVNEPSNLPGSHWVTKQGMESTVKRLGGVAANSGLLGMIEFIQDRMEDTNGNYATKGAEPQRVTTASGFAQLREDRDSRAQVKKAGRLQGFARLAELCDWMALEFYNQDREILIRGKKEDEPDTTINFNSDNERMVTKYSIDPETGMEIPEEFYYPKIDVEITAGDGIQKSKAFTLAATQELAKMVIGPENLAIVMSILDLLDLPDKNEVKEQLQRVFAPPDLVGAYAGLPPEIQPMVAQMPPEQRDAFLMAPPEQQLQVLEQMMGQGMPQGPPQGMAPQQQMMGGM